MTHDLYLWNDTPVVEEGSWRLLVPNNYAKRYKNCHHPVVVHKCPLKGQEYILTSQSMKEGNPRCGECDEQCPDNVQGVYCLHQFDEMAP